MKSFVVGLLIFLGLPAIKASDTAADRSSLREVNAFYVVVEDIDRNAVGLTPDDIRIDVEQSCRRAGVTVTEANSTLTFLYIHLQLMRPELKRGRSSNGHVA